MQSPIPPFAPEIAEMLPALRGRFPKPWTATEVRADIEQRAAARAPVLPHVQAEDGPVGGVPARIYRTRSGSSPTVLFLHGGGWVAGSVRSHDDLARRIAAEVDGVVVSINYRRPPEAPFPAPIDDCRDALEGVFAELPSFGGDLLRVGVAGDSAGANLALGLLLANGRHFPIAAQLLLYPAIDLRGLYADAEVNARYASRLSFCDGPGLTLELLQWFAANYCPLGSSAGQAQVSPIIADLAELPPTVIGLAQCDPLRDEGAAFAQRISAAGVDHVVHEGQGLVHGYFGLAQLSSTARAEMAAVLASFARLLGQSS